MSNILIQKNKPAWVVRSVTPQKDYTLDLQFNDGSRRIFSAKDHVTHPALIIPQDINLFMQAHLVGSSVGWTDEIDIAPEYLYENSHIVNAQN